MPRLRVSIKKLIKIESITRPNLYICLHLLGRRSRTFRQSCHCGQRLHQSHCIAHQAQYTLSLYQSPSQSSEFRVSSLCSIQSVWNGGLQKCQHNKLCRNVFTTVFDPPLNSGWSRSLQIPIRHKRLITWKPAPLFCLTQFLKDVQRLQNPGHPFRHDDHCLSKTSAIHTQRNVNTPWMHPSPTSPFSWCTWPSAPTA